MQPKSKRDLTSGLRRQKQGINDVNHTIRFDRHPVGVKPSKRVDWSVQ